MNLKKHIRIAKDNVEKYFYKLFVGANQYIHGEKRQTVEKEMLKTNILALCLIASLGNGHFNNSKENKKNTTIECQNDVLNSETINFEDIISSQMEEVSDKKDEKVAKTEEEKKIVVIDPGHGGIDKGTSVSVVEDGNGRYTDNDTKKYMSEADVTHKIADKVAEILRSTLPEGKFDVKLSKDKDETISAAKESPRGVRINEMVRDYDIGNSMVVTIHADCEPIPGSTYLCNPNKNPKMDNVADKILNDMEENFGIENRGGKLRPNIAIMKVVECINYIYLEVGAQTKEIYVNKNGKITTEDDKEAISKGTIGSDYYKITENIDGIAESIAKGIVEYYGYELEISNENLTTVYVKDSNDEYSPVLVDKKDIKNTKDDICSEAVYAKITNDCYTLYSIGKKFGTDIHELNKDIDATTINVGDFINVGFVNTEKIKKPSDNTTRKESNYSYEFAESTDYYPTSFATAIDQKLVNSINSGATKKTYVRSRRA